MQNDAGKDAAGLADLAAEVRVDHLLERLRNRGLEAEPDELWGGGEFLVVRFPSGRDSKRDLFCSLDSAIALLEHEDLEHVRFLGDYEAIVNTRTGLIEARVRFRGAPEVLTRLPGVEDLDEEIYGVQESLWSPDGDVEPDAVQPKAPKKWRLVVEESGVKIELSPMSALFRAVSSLGDRGWRVPTIKIEAHTENEVANLTALEALSDAFFFDLDVRYNRALALQSRPPRGPYRRVPASGEPARFPRNRYPAQPMSLYQYARSATGLPLLAFLGFYQVLEFFFPIFTREESIQRLRQALRHPQFDPNSDVALGRILGTLGESRGAGVSEREQLRATLRRCLTTDEIREIVESSEGMAEHFCARKQAVKGVERLNLGGGAPDLRDQVADRIYAIRCRIVHTKQDGGETGVDLLLPSGREARSLLPDIELVRLAAQQALIAGATPLDPLDLK